MVPLPAPGCPPCFQSRNESSAAVQEVPQEQATDGCSKESTEWHQGLNNPVESCIRKVLLHHLPLQQDQHFWKGGKESLSEEPFHILEQTDPAYKIKAIMCKLLLLVSAQRMAASLLTLLSLHQQGVYSHTTCPIPQC